VPKDEGVPTNYPCLMQKDGLRRVRRLGRSVGRLLAALRT
jgi:hypothetical protein